MTTLHCTECGVQTEAHCSCGKKYQPMSKTDAAALCVAAHPDWNDAKIAEAIGVGETTVRRSRNQFRQNGETAEPKRTGKDGKSYPTRKKVRARKNNADRERAAAKRVLDEGLSYKEAAAREGIDGTEQVMKTAVAREEGRRAEQTDPEIDPATLSKSAQEKLASAMRQHKKKLDNEFESRVQAGVRQRLEEMVYPAWRKKEDDFNALRNRRKGVLTKEQYNIILKCIHPDRSPDHAEKTTATTLWTHPKIRLLLLTEKDDPRTYPPLPSLDEMLRHRGRRV